MALRRAGCTFLLRKKRGLFRLALREAARMCRKSMPVSCRVGCARCIRYGTAWQHDDAVHRAGGNTQLAAGAELCDYSMGELLRAKNGINRARREALYASDAARFVDLRNQRRSLDPVDGIEC